MGEEEQWMFSPRSRIKIFVIMKNMNNAKRWNWRKCLFLLWGFFLGWGGIATYAVSAYPGWIRHRCPDGTFVNLKLKGDEHHKWAVTEDGYTLLRDREGDWCYAAEDCAGEVRASAWKLSAERPEKLSVFLRHTPKGLKIQQDLGNLKSRKTPHARKPATPVAGERKTLVILMQFPDLELKHSWNEINALFNQAGYREDGAEGSVKDFFRENSYGRLDLNCDIVGPFTSSMEMAYYGRNDRSGSDEHPEELFLEALDLIPSDIDLEDYVDQDGYMNNVHLVFAGYGEEAAGPANAIWSHEATFYEPIEFGGVKIKGYSCAPELRGNQGRGLSRIGVHCHEMGHSFGAMDFYDTDYESGGEFSGMGQWDLMASGSWNNEGISPAHFNPYVKTMFGWTECETLAEGYAELFPSLECNKVFRIDTGTDGDYFLLENRRQAGFDSALPGSGLIIYHILPQIEERAADNRINAAYPQTCYPVCAGGEVAVPNRNPASYGRVNSPECPFPGKNVVREFTARTVPAAISSEGASALVGLEEIREEDGGIIRLNVKAGEGEALGMLELPFADSFEADETAWTFEQLKGNTGWEIGGSEIIGVSMEAADGKRYLKMNNGKGLLGFQSVARAISPVIKNDSGNMWFSFMYHNGGRFSESGTLKVLYKSTTQKNWLPLVSFSERNEGWIQYKGLMLANKEDFQIAFEGEVESGSLLIDDVKIYSDVATSTSPMPMNPVSLACYGMRGKVCVESNESVRFRIYDLTGKVVYSGTLKEGLNTIEMDPGLYIGVSGKAVSKFSVY